MKVRSVVTGGAGVVGQELVSMLVERGEQVRVVDRLPRPAQFGPEVEYIQADLNDVDASALVGSDPQVLYHLAAAFERSTENPDFWLQNAADNVQASQSVLRAACKAPSLRKYVFASSYLVYDTDQFISGEPPSEPVCLTEDSLIDPRNACGAAKLLHEKEAHLASESPAVSFDVVSARIYRVYGRSSRDVVSRWIRAALADERVTLFGPESYFDYIHARDVAEGLMRLADSDATGPVNLGSGSAQRVSDMVANLTTHFPDFAIDGPHPAEQYEASQADVSRLEALTGWSPRISLEEGVSDLVAHERENARRGVFSPRVVEAPNVRIMISSLSRKSTLAHAARRALESSSVEGVVIGADADPNAPAQLVVDEFWAMPTLSSLSDQQLLSELLERDVTIVVPTRDGELQRFAEVRSLLEEAGIWVAVGSPESVKACLDKVETYRRCSDAGVPAIETSRVIEDLSSEGPFVVKSRFGAGSRDIALGVSLEEAVSAAKALSDPVFQPFVDGPEFSVDGYVDRNGSVVGLVVRERRLVVNGESQVTSTVDRPDILTVASRALGALGVTGHSVLQVIDGPNGPVVVEVNARVGGASAASFAAGLASFDYMIAEALGRPVQPLSPIGIPLTLTRLPSDTVTFG